MSADLIPNPKARKLTWAQAEEVRRLRGVNRFKYTYRALAQQFGVKHCVIRDIILGVRYAKPESPVHAFMTSTPEQREKWRVQAKARRKAAADRRAEWRAMQQQRNEDAQAWRT